MERISTQEILQRHLETTRICAQEKVAVKLRMEELAEKTKLLRNTVAEMSEKHQGLKLRTKEILNTLSDIKRD